jgi:hypothetical protein
MSKPYLTNDEQPNLACPANWGASGSTTRQPVVPPAMGKRGRDPRGGPRVHADGGSRDLAARVPSILPWWNRFTMRCYSNRAAATAARDCQLQGRALLMSAHRPTGHRGRPPRRDPQLRGHHAARRRRVPAACTGTPRTPQDAAGADRIHAAAEAALFERGAIDVAVERLPITERG